MTMCDCKCGCQERLAAALARIADSQPDSRSVTISVDPGPELDPRAMAAELVRLVERGMR